MLETVERRLRRMSAEVEPLRPTGEVFLYSERTSDGTRVYHFRSGKAYKARQALEYMAEVLLEVRGELVGHRWHGGCIAAFCNGKDHVDPTGYGWTEPQGSVYDPERNVYVVQEPSGGRGR